MRKKKDELMKIYTVIPHDFELCTVHFQDKEQAEAFAITYRDGAVVIENELSTRVVNAKAKKIARKGYKV